MMLQAVPNARSPASPKPGTIMPCSFSTSSTIPQYTRRPAATAQWNVYYFYFSEYNCEESFPGILHVYCKFLNRTLKPRPLETLDWH